MKALIVDDSATMRRILMNVLAEIGITDVAEATDGDEGVARATGEAFDIVLLDWNMPKVLGIDALRELRARGNRVPVLMVTTEGEKKRVVEAIREGANGYVLKPFEKEKLAEKIRRVLDEPASA